MLKLQHKLKFAAYVAASIDGRIAKDSKSNSSEWTSKEDWKFFQDALAKSDAVIVGSNTFKMAKARLVKRNTIVFTSKVKEPKTSGSVTFLNPKYIDPVKFLNKNSYKKVAIIGGPKVYNYFLEQGIPHDLYATIEPCVFSDGVPMFSGKFKRSDFSFQSVKKLNKNGTLLLKYKYGN